MSNQKSNEKHKEEYDEEKRRSESKKKENQKKKEKEQMVKEEVNELEKINYYTKEITIPIVKLVNVEIVKKEVEIDKNIPIINEEERAITIPIVTKEKLRVELNYDVFSKELPKVDIHKSELRIPFIKLQKNREIRTIIENFNDIIPKISPRIKKTLRIPLFRLLNRPELINIMIKFDNSIDNQFLRNLISSKDKEELKRQLMKEQIPIIDSQYSEEGGISEPSEGLEDYEEPPDIINNIFNISNEQISSEDPKIILYKELEEDSTIGSFETLCINIYREKKGGKPEIQPIEKLDDFNKKEIEKWVKADKKIVTIDLDYEIKSSKEWFSEEKLRELIKRSIIGDLGFIIFKTRNNEIFKHCRKVLENLEKEIEHLFKVLYIIPKPLPFEKKKEFSSLIWGKFKLDFTEDIAIKFPEIKRYIGHSIFDDIFNKISKELFEKCLKELKSENYSAYSNATKPHEGESPEHKKLKWFIVKYLTKKLINQGNLKPKNLKNPKSFEITEFIKTEEDTQELLKGREMVDVIDKYNGEVYEIETLFAEDKEGKTPSEKINYTIDKYKKEESIKKINIVLLNLTFLRHLKTLKNVKLNKQEEERKRINFYTLDLQNSELISYKSVIERLKKIISKNES